MCASSSSLRASRELGENSEISNEIWITNFVQFSSRIVKNVVWSSSGRQKDAYSSVGVCLRKCCCGRGGRKEGGRGKEGTGGER